MTKTLFKCFSGILLLIFSALLAAAEDRALFWRVQSPNATVYLMGSMHFADAGFYPLRGEITKAFQESDHLVVEVDIGQLAPQQLQMMMVQGTYPPGESLQDHISRETWSELEQLVLDLGLPPALIERQRPGLVVITLGAQMMARQGLNPLMGIDNHFLQAARAQGKRILELESIDGQLNMLLNLGEDDLLLRQTGDDLRDMQRNLEALITAWKKGDEPGLYEMLIGDPLRQNPEYQPVYEKLFFQRNRAMSGKIESWLQAGGRYFVVVGAGHLVGQKGIIDILAAAGYDVERR